MRSRSFLLATAAAALFAASAATAHRLAVGEAKPYDVAFVPNATALRWISLGHPTLAANVTWLRAVQYMGEPRADQRGWEKLRPLVEVVTDLDPKHGYAYQTSANILSSSGFVADSNAILEKGTRNCPDRYILPFHRAVNAFLYAGDYAEAGRWFEIAARRPGAREHVRDYVVAMYAKGNAGDTAIAFLRRLRAEAQDDESRRGLEKQIRRATLERDATRIEAAAEWFRGRWGFAPVVPEQLVFTGALAAIPPDPYGGTYYFDAEGRVRSSAFGERFERPLTPAERNGSARAQRAVVQEYERSLR